MPDLLRARKSPLKTLFGFGFHLFDLIAYEVLYRFSPARKHWFFNGGYLPLDADYIPHPDFAGEDHCAMMYHQAAHTQIREFGLQPLDILDVGCGQGGGLVYVSRLFPNAALSGTERSLSAVALARRRIRPHTRAQIFQSKSNRLAFANTSFDLVLSVGAPTYFGLTRFVTEAARVLRPGGVISISGGYRQGDHAQIEDELRNAAQANGLVCTSYRDITPHTFASLKADIPRREVQLAKVPWPFSLYAVKWADMPGSAEYDEYETGKRADFAAVFHKPALQDLGV
ncbi:class I SAM-dependent methyltransferase [Roseibaca sp. V10]|uniref:Class I SAM-dependent methyltransferase n=1 Tax=Roseinatronobacter domitianus TaxID=2940293 RepID=A0ABT0M768_9RHOB|nr:class I SAM-dependent methyltransferase [Roseibaca domitiana]MCL1630154.1 class I SAM-dependent methyltransferase [Roseibaca domitiana]